MHYIATALDNFKEQLSWLINYIKFLARLVGPKCLLRIHKGVYNLCLHYPLKNVVQWMLYSVAGSGLKLRIVAKTVQQFPSIFTHQKRSCSAISLAVMKVHWQ